MVSLIPRLDHHRPKTWPQIATAIVSNFFVIYQVFVCILFRRMPPPELWASDYLYLAEDRI